jgi:hypothetical protein
MLSRVLSLNTAQGASTEYHGYLYSLGDPTITLLYGFSITSIDYRRVQRRKADKLA